MDVKRPIDLNLDAGEVPENLADGTEEKLCQVVSSINIACGGHAGDESSMLAMIQLASKYDLKIGAHPSFPDRLNFGRNLLDMPMAKLRENLLQQILALAKLCHREKAKLSHVKAHGALYHLTANDKSYGEMFIDAIQEFNHHLVAQSSKESRRVSVVTFAGAPLIDWCRQRNLETLREAFVDRTYLSNGQLQDRKEPGSVIEDPELAANQAWNIVTNQTVQSKDGSSLGVIAETLCIHGDTKNALQIAQAVQERLQSCRT